MDATRAQLCVCATQLSPPLAYGLPPELPVDGLVQLPPPPDSHATLPPRCASYLLFRGCGCACFPDPSLVACLCYSPSIPAAEQPHYRLPSPCRSCQFCTVSNTGCSSFPYASPPSGRCLDACKCNIETGSLRRARRQAQGRGGGGGEDSISKSTGFKCQASARSLISPRTENLRSAPAALSALSFPCHCNCLCTELLHRLHELRQVHAHDDRDLQCGTNRGATIRYAVIS